MIAIEMGNNEIWNNLAEKHECTVDEAKDLMIKFAIRGAFGNYEDEIKQLDNSVYSNDEQDWLDRKFYEVDGEIVDYSAYVLETHPSGFILVARDQVPVSNFVLIQVGRNLRRDVWHTVEVSIYEGLMEIWIDGRRFMTYQDRKPLPDGKLGLLVAESADAESVAYFDDISICELTAPFVPLPTPDS